MRRSLVPLLLVLLATPARGQQPPAPAPASPAKPAQDEDDDDDVPRHWSGRWADRSSPLAYDFELDLDGPAGALRGRLTWVLRVAPTGSPQAARIGATAHEELEGSWDRGQHELHLVGTSIDDDKMLGSPDEYRLVVAPDGATLTGTSRSGGAWGNVMSARAEGPPALDATTAFGPPGRLARGWSFGEGAGARFAALERFARGPDGLESWTAEDETACVARAPSRLVTAEGYPLAPGALFVHPGASGPTVLRWRAPEAGRWRARARVEGLGPATKATVDLGLSSSAGPLWKDALNLRGRPNVATCDVVRQLAAGEVVELALSDGGNGFGWDGCAVTLELSRE